jgi:DNA-binding XRE family transcriptional regulator
VSGQDQSRQAHDSAKNFPLIRARFNAGLTQEQLGDAAGLSKQTISALENGARPQAPNAKRTGARDLRVYPASYRKSGRRNQGAMTPLWAPVAYSESLGKFVCIACFQKQFYARTRAAA